MLHNHGIVYVLLSSASTLMKTKIRFEIVVNKESEGASKFARCACN